MRNDVKNDNQKKNMTKKTRRKRKNKKKEGKQKQQNEMKGKEECHIFTLIARGLQSVRPWPTDRRATQQGQKTTNQIPF